MSIAVPRLGIIVPYRDRAEHLSQLVPHMAAYFTRDKIDQDIPITLAIVEQPFGRPFNRGLIKNIGFKVLRDSVDYVCFHDVDYLPIWADSSPVDRPTPIVWYGAEERLIAPRRTNMVANLGLFFSGALLVRPSLQQRDALAAPSGLLGYHQK